MPIKYDNFIIFHSGFARINTSNDKFSFHHNNIRFYDYLQMYDYIYDYCQIFIWIKIYLLNICTLYLTTRFLNLLNKVFRANYEKI